MNTFVNAVKTVPVEARTENGMLAQESTMSSVVDFFYNVGALRASKRSVTPYFARAFAENSDLALRVAQWARDVRGGAGERQIFRDILLYLEKNERDVLLNTNFLNNVANVGRWDDLLVFENDPEVKSKAFDLIYAALKAGNGLCAKWMPRKGAKALELRNALGLTPKAYRKTLVGLTKVVETPMCAKDYGNINYSHVPSLAMSRYMKAFTKNDSDRFVAFRESLKKGEVKINASAVYPYDIIKTIKSGGDKEVASEQWKALPDYMNDANVLPMVDVSGSMGVSVGGNANLQCIDIALSLGLYCADKNKGAYKDMFLTFSESPELLVLKGSLHQKMEQMNRSKWDMNTNLHAAFDRILDVAVKGKVSAADMPQIVLILSDMEFDACAQFDDSAMKMIRRKYEAAGYKVPTVVFWNLNSRSGHAPVSFNEKGVALVSGFSPSIMKAILGADMDTLSPESIVRDAVMVDRYNYL